MGWVDKQVNNVKRFVSNPGKSVNNLFKDVGNTVTNLLKDPKALAILAINIYAPGAGSAIGAAMGITNATAAAFIGNTVLNTALNGGDVNAAAKSAALQIGGQKLADTVTAGLADTAISTATKQIIGNTTSAATIAAIQGKDPMAAIAAGGISYGVSAITSQYDGFDKLPAASQKAVRTVLTGALSGAKDAKITSDLVYGAIGSGIQAYKNVSDGNAATQKELGRDLTDEEAKKLALYSSANTASTDIKNLVVGEKSAKAIESGQSSYTYDGKPVAVSGTDINNYFKDKLTTAGITPTAADISAASTAYGKSKDAAGATNAVVDSRTLNEKEVKDIYAKEGVTNPTADMIAKYVKSNVDAATVAADAQKEIDANSTNLDESNAYLKSILGRNPTEKEAAAFVGNKPEEANLTRDNAYTTLVDLLTNPQNNPVKAGPGVDVAATSGGIYNATDKEIADLKAKGIDLPKINDSWSPVMQSPEDNVLREVTIYGDRKLDPLEEVQLDVLLAITERNPLFKEELRDVDNAFEKQGYVPTIEELLNIVNQTNGKPKEETKTAVTNYVNANTVTKDEAKQRLIDNGISKPTDEQINQFVKKGNETDVFKKIDEYANPLSVTAKEAEQMLKDAGITKPTKEQIAMFTKEGSQADTQKALDTYASPFVTTAQEVKDMYAKIGYTNPTQEEIDRYTGEKPEAVQLDMAKTYGASALAAKQYIDPLNARIEELVKQGNDYQAAQQAAAQQAAADKIAADKAAAIKLAADKVTAAKNLKQQTFANNVMMNMAANAPSGNVSTVAQPVSTVEAAPVFNFEHPLDIGFFNQQDNTQKDTQDQSGVVKIAQGGYMDMFHPHEAGGIDEILRILEGK